MFLLQLVFGVLTLHSSALKTTTIFQRTPSKYCLRYIPSYNLGLPTSSTIAGMRGAEGGGQPVAVNPSSAWHYIPGR